MQEAMEAGRLDTGGAALTVAEEPAASRVRLVGQPCSPGLLRVYLTRQAHEFVTGRARCCSPGEAVGGLLLGQAFRSPSGHPFVRVDGVAEAPEVEAAALSVKLSPRSWRSLWAAAATALGRRQVVGWFHGRPGEPPHLSPYETFVHQTHFGAPWQVAMVVDPASGVSFTAWNGEALERLPGFYLHDAPASVILTAEEVLELADGEGSHREAASGMEPAVDEGMRGTWAVSPVQARVAYRARQRASWWQRVARTVQLMTVLVLVFVAAMLARWAIERSWPQLVGRSRTPAPGVAGGALPPAPGPVAPAAGESAPREGPQTATAVMGGGPGQPAAPGTAPQVPGMAPDGAGAAEAAGGQPPGASGPAGPDSLREGAGAGQAPVSGGDLPGKGGTRAVEYVVQPGDTLWDISQRFYGDPARSRWLAQVNGVTDPRRLLAGQRLILPPAGDVTPSRK